VLLCEYCIIDGSLDLKIKKGVKFFRLNNGVVMKKIWKWILYFVERFWEDNCLTHATTLAYTTLLTFVPLLMVFFWILSFFPVFSGVVQGIRQFIIDNFIADSAAAVSKYVVEFLKQIQVMTWTNVISLFLASALMMYNVVRSVNEIWRVKLHGYAAFSFLIYFVILIVTPLVLGALFLISSYLVSLPIIGYAKWTPPYQKYAFTLLSYLFTLSFFTFFNWKVPSCKVHWRAAVLGGFVTAVLFELAKKGFTLYLSYFPTYQLIYGALATIPILLVWLYIAWVIILLGVLITEITQAKFSRNH
jgi:membrane protein